MGFADAGRALDQHVLMPLDEARGGEIEDLLAGNRGIEAEVEALERLLEIEARPPQPQGELLLGPTLHLVFQEPLEKFDKRKLLLHGLPIPELQGFEDPREPQALELGDELMGESHGHASRTKKSVQGRANRAGGSAGRGTTGAMASSPCCKIRLMTT